MVKRLLVIICLFMSFSTAFAVTRTSTAAGGNWVLGTSWVGGVAPAAGDDVIIVSGSSINVTTNQTCVNLTLNGTANLNFNTNNRTLTVNGTFTMNGNSTVSGNNNNRILSLNGDFNIPSGQTGSIGGVRVVQAIGGTFNLGGTFTPTDNTGTKTLGQANFFDGCLIDAAVTEAVTIAGNLAVMPNTPGLHSKIGRISLTVTGTTTVTGYMEFANSGSGAKTFNGTITVAAGGTWDNIVGEDPIINCSIVNNGVWPQPTGGNGRYDVNVAGTYTYTGSREITMTRLRIQSASTVTNNTALRLTQTANSALTVNSGGTFNNGDGVATAYLTFTGYNDVVNLGGGGSVVNFANANNTVDYASSTNQNVYPTTYDQLICSGDNTATVNGTTTVNTALSITGSTIVDVTGGTDLNGTGTLTMSGTSQLILSSSGTVPALTGTPNSLASGTTIELNRAGAQTAASSANFPYQNLIISGNAGSAVNMDAVTTIAEDFTVTNAGRFNNTLNTPVLMTVLGDFTYSSTASTTLNTNLTTGSVAISSGTFIYTDRTITIDQNNGFWNVTGAPVITATGVAQVAFTTGTNQTIGGTTNPSFNNLVINNNNDVTINVATVTPTTLTLSNGMLITGTNVVVIPLAGTVTKTNGWVFGNLNKAYALGSSSRTFEVGTSTGYSPAIFPFTSVTTAGTLTVAAVDGDHPEINSGLIEPSNTVNRYWSVLNNGIVFSGFSVGRVGATFTWVNGDEDVLLDNTAIIKWYNNSTLTWAGTDQFDEITEQNPQMTIATNIATNNSVFTLMNPLQLPSGQLVDFQVGEKIDPTFVYNRLTGANNWNNLATWIQQRSGVITLTNGSPTITGSSTTFQTELVVGDNIMLLTNPATVYTVTAINPILQSITVAPAPAVSTSGGYGRQYIPGINSPISDVDAVVIGNTNIADATTTITLDIDAQVLTLDIGSTSRATAQALTHQSAAMDLTVLANAAVNQPSGNVTNAWNINAGTADVQGDVTIGSAANNTVTRVSQINITTGTLSAGNLKFKPFNAAGREVQTILNFTGAGTVNLHGALTFTGNRGKLNTVAGSIFNFDRTASAQTIAVPSGSTAAWIYANIHSNNTSAAGSVFGFTSSATSVTGNIRVQTGKMSVTNFDIVGAAGSTFQVADGATFEMKSTLGSGVGGFPSGFGTITLGATSTVEYNQTGNVNPWPVRNTNYGHLVIGQNASVRNFEIANATTNVLGNLTIGSGTSTPNLQATGTATLNVTGNILVNTGASLDGTNMTAINVGGDWTDNGNFSSGNNTVTFNSPAANVLQTLGGTASDTFYNLTINTSAGTDFVQLNKDISVSHNTVLTLGGLDLNGNTLNVDRSNTAALSRTSGFIKSENITAPYGTIRWFINNSTGSFQYPFGKASGQYIPVILNVTAAGARGIGSGYIPVSTYATAANNPPGEYPATVNNLNGTSGGTSVVDRYWVITVGSAEFSTTRPTSTVTFTALNTEKPTTWTAIGEPPTNPNFLLAQRWNTANYWDPAQSSPAQTYANNSPAAGTFQVDVPAVTSYSTTWTITDSSVPLPIELVEFTAALEQGVVELKWKTETEVDNDFFTVQRTTDAEKFENILDVKGAGTTTLPRAYTAVDFRPQIGKTYYRLKQTDFNGKFTYSKLVTVNVSDAATWKVYPNPSDGNSVAVNFSVKDLGKPAYVKLHDISGKELHEVIAPTLESTDLRIDFPQRLSPGIYVITMAVESQITRQKLIVR